MIHIAIIGDGLASTAVRYYLRNTTSEVEVTVLSLPPKGNWSVDGGVRFLHPPTPNQPVYEDFVGSARTIPIGGGVIYKNKGNSVNKYSWEELVANPVLRISLTESYAAEQGRIWSPDIMNGLINLSDVPSELVYPYSDGINKLLLGASGKDYKTRLFSSFHVDLAHKKVYCAAVDGDGAYSVPYDYLINTIPLWVFLQSSLRVDITPGLSAPRWEIRREYNLPQNKMWYVVGFKGVKRISNFGGQQIAELITDKYEEIDSLPFLLEDGYGANLHTHWSEFKKLPPNLPPQSEEVRNLMQSDLEPNHIYCVGRFAEMLPKMMFGDVLESAYRVVSRLG